ncbi:MAG: DUF3504 domain-containing protein [Pseudomonadota bacterium]
MAYQYLIMFIFKTDIVITAQHCYPTLIIIEMETFESDDLDWPLLDFSDFPNEMISGMTLREIQDHVNENNDNTGYTTNDSYDIAHKAPQSSRFAEPVGDAELHKKKKSTIPVGTNNRNNWSMNLFNRWANQREVTEFDDSTFNLPKNFSELMTANERSINYWLAKFIYETRKSNGNRFPGNSLGQITAGINSLFKENGKNINLFVDDSFEHFRATLDLACKEAAKNGIGISKKQAEVITIFEEDKMWNIGCLGGDSPQQLLDTLLYLNGLHFALRSGLEHRNLTVQQLEVFCVSIPQSLFLTHFPDKR